MLMTSGPNPRQHARRDDVDGLAPSARWVAAGDRCRRCRIDQRELIGAKSPAVGHERGAQRALSGFRLCRQQDGPAAARDDRRMDDDQMVYAAADAPVEAPLQKCRRHQPRQRIEGRQTVAVEESLPAHVPAQSGSGLHLDRRGGSRPGQAPGTGRNATAGMPPPPRASIGTSPTTDPLPRPGPARAAWQAAILSIERRECHGTGSMRSAGSSAVDSGLCVGALRLNAASRTTDLVQVPRRRGRPCLE